MPGYPVLHCLPEFAQIQVHCVSDAIQPSHPLPTASPFAFNSPQHQSFPVSPLFASGGQSIGTLASVLLMNIQGSFPLELTDLISLQSKDLLRVISSTIIQKHQFLSVQAFLRSNSHIPHLPMQETQEMRVQFLGQEDPLE